MDVKQNKINIREFQHNVTTYLELAKTVPITITKYGVDEAVIVNTDFFKLIKKNKTKEKGQKMVNLMNLEFVGLHKNRKDWKDKTSMQIAKKLRKEAWHGKKNSR